MGIIFVRALIIYIFVIGAVRLMGKRQVGELKPQELVITMLLGAVAAVPLEDNSMPLANCLIPIMLFVSLEILSSLICMKSIKIRNFIQGKPVFIIRRGKLNQKKMKQLRLTIDDIVDALRQKDIFDISQVEEAVIETNGTITVLPKPEYRPITPDDVSLSVKNDGMPITIVMDGKPVTDYFNDENVKISEIELILKEQNADVKKIMLLTVDDSGNTYRIRKEP